MDTYFKRIRISREMVERALVEFDRAYPDTNQYDRWIEKRNYKYAILERGRRYPPKHILSVVCKVDTIYYNGGEQTNRVFRKLGFKIIQKGQK